jgi:hypothetical protein
MANLSNSIIEVEMKDPILGIELKVKGKQENIDFILSSWQRRANFLKYRFSNPENSYWMQNQTPISKESLPAIKPSEKIKELISLGFFKEQRTLSEISEEIQKKFKIYMPNNSLHPTLMSFIIKGALERTRKENNRWAYKIKGEIKKENAL